MLGHTIGRRRGVEGVLRALHDPEGPDVSTTVSTPEGLRFLANTGSWIEWNLFMYGNYEPALRDYLKQTLKPGDNVIDAGANIGVHTLTMAQLVGPEGRVFAFEPLDEVRTRLVWNVIANGFSDSVEVDSRALSDQAGNLEFAPPDGSVRSMDATVGGGLFVDATTLDILELPRIRLIKLDVELSEHRVILGARELLRRDGPRLLVEVMPETEAPIGSALASCGYRITGWVALRVAIAEPAP